MLLKELLLRCLDHLMKDRTTLVIAHRLSTEWTQLEFLDKEGQFSSLGSTQRLAFE
ncbi:hypothetical protein Peur_072893 [Populus x canadensis]